MPRVTLSQLWSGNSSICIYLARIYPNITDYPDCAQSPHPSTHLPPIYLTVQLIPPPIDHSFLRLNPSEAARFLGLETAGEDKSEETQKEKLDGLQAQQQQQISSMTLHCKENYSYLLCLNKLVEFIYNFFIIFFYLYLCNLLEIELLFHTKFMAGQLLYVHRLDRLHLSLQKEKLS